jgi:membrane-associated protease RseP (regulator of RpoE activity)
MRAPARHGLLAVAIALAIGPGAATANESDDSLDRTPWLGISYSPASGTVGLLVTNVFDESAAIAAGLRTGDEIIEVDGVPTPAGSDLSGLIQPRQIGETVTVRVFRENRVVTLHPELTRRLSEAELIHVQLVGKVAPAFNLIRPEEPEGDVIDDSILRGKVGVMLWFHTGCNSCPALANKIAPWVDAHRGAVGVVGLGGRSDLPVEQMITAMQAIVKATPILMPVGLDPDAFLRYGVLDWQAYNDKAVVVVVDRTGVVQMAAAIRGDADDSALDDVYAAAERALKPTRKARRAK